MNLRAVALVFLVCLAPAARTQSLFPVRDSSSGQARDRSYHVVHYKIEVSFDEAKKSVIGRTSITLIPFLPQLRTVDLDAEQLKIDRVTLDGKAQQFSVLPKELQVSLDKPYRRNDSLTLVIDYTCTPKHGLYFIGPDTATPDEPRQIWSQGEDMDNHFWFPCYDYPNDKATSELIATVRKSYVVLSNGRLVSVTEDKKHGTKTFHWKQDLPHASYLIMMAAGEYAVLRDSSGSVPLEYYVYPDRVDDARASFAETPKIMKFFNEKIGFPYPWGKYAQVAIHNFMYGGMENTSATTLLDESIQLDSRTRVDQNAVGLIAHEMAHQWWGDVVTCKDWRNIWLNEGFASYFDPLYIEASRGEDAFQFDMYHNQRSAINTDRSLGRKPIVSIGSYTSNVYSRGSDVLHMLRHLLGDELFYDALRHYITKYQYQSVETYDLKEAIEEATGQNLYWFFDQWLYNAGHPVFDVSYRWSDTARAVLMSVKQTQKIDSLTGVFRVPVDIQVTTPGGTTTYSVGLHSRDTLLRFPCAEKPSLVLFDKGNWTLKELHFEKSRDEWKYQARKASDALDRFLAIKELEEQPDTDDAVAELCTIAAGDSFHEVRREAVLALGEHKSHDDAVKKEILTAILDATRDHDPSVRSVALEQLGGLKDFQARSVLYAALRDSSNAVLANDLGALAKVDSTHAADTIASFLKFPSYRNTIANAALSALASIDSNRAIVAAFEMVKPQQHLWGRWSAIRILERYPSVRPQLIKELTPLIQDKSAFIRSMAIRYLGQYGDPALIPALEAIASDKENPSSRAAEEAVKRLRVKEGNG
ncbi:MAG: M1 family metallopeptidase [Bacteroidota bacterium]